MRRLLVIAALALSACGEPTSTAPVSGAATATTEAATLALANLPAFFDCLRAHSATIVSAHRGGPAPGYAENAIPTFEHTLSLAPAAAQEFRARPGRGISGRVEGRAAALGSEGQIGR